jgi:hypothetical protein
MKPLVLLFVCAAAAWAQASLRGTVTDPSGAAVPRASVELAGPSGVMHVRTDSTGAYSFSRLDGGKYALKVTARGFARVHRDVFINGETVYDMRLAIETASQSIRVEGRTGQVSTEPGSNGGAVVLGDRQIAALSDDPDELALELQALAGPAPGPDGGQIYIDGFTGGNLPPKSAIREVRINSNPFAPEFDRPGFARVDIFTKAGSESLHGQGLTSQNSDALDTRNPLVPQKPPYRSQLYSLDLAGPVQRNKASFTIDLEERKINDNATILAATPAGTLDETYPAPQSRTAISPRVDYALNDRNNLTVRYQQIWNTLDNQGVGGFNLPSEAYHEAQREQMLQVTETAMLNPRLVTETRFQYLKATDWDNAANFAQAIDVVGAFSTGGAPVGDSGNVTGNWEASSLTIYAAGKHTVKWGVRARDARLTDTSRNNFAGTYTFYSLAEFEAGMPAQFSRNAGDPATRVRQADLGAFAGDDWRARSNLTLSLGMRYQTQTNLGGRLDFAPRAGLAWNLGKAVLRVGAGIFYDLIPLATTLNRLRYNGVTQQSYLILYPPFFPAVPSIADLAAGQQPQEFQPVASRFAAPRLYQSSVGIERQLNTRSRVSLTEVESRGLHLQDQRNINTPVDGLYPFGDASIQLLLESSGVSRQHQLVANTNTQWRRLFLFGFYALSYGEDDNEGLPANPYNLRAEWGPSTYGDIRNRVALGGTVQLPGRWTISPFVVANSGIPYNITTGFDPRLAGAPEARPALVAGPCDAESEVYSAAFGCFELLPPPGTPVIGRNYGRGPADANLALRLAHTWQFGTEGRSGMSDTAGGHAGPPAGIFSSGATRRYQLTLSATTMYALNRANFAPPDGDLSSPYFGQYRSLGGLIVMMHGGAPNSYNRKVDLQLQFTF